MRFPALPTRRCVAPMRSTTHQLRALYPLVAEAPITAGGVLLGEDQFGAAWHYDAFAYYGAQLVQDPNVFVAGAIGAGKSTLVTIHAWRQLAFGRWVWIVDSKPQILADGTKRSQYHQLAEAFNRAQEAYAAAVGDTVENLGLAFCEPIMLTPGGWLTVNPLDAPEGRDQMLEDVLAISLRRGLRSKEQTAVRVALGSAERAAAPDAPTLSGVAVALLAPAPSAGEAVYLSDDELRAVGQEAGHALLGLAEGPLRGMFDGQTSPALRDAAAAPVRILDLSALHNRQAEGLVMMLADRWFQADIDGGHGQGIYVLEEAWKPLASLAVAVDHQARYKFARGSGVSYWAVIHRLSDLHATGPEGSRTRELVQGLLADSATRIVFRQRSDQLPATREMLGLTDRAMQHVGRLRRGQAFWAVGDRWSIVTHKVASTELDLVNTDHAMRGEEGDK